VITRRRDSRRTTVPALVLGSTVLALATGALAPSSAQAAARTPAKPSAVRVTANGGSSFTITTAKATYARTYRVSVSTTRGDLAVAHIATARRSATVTSPRLTITGLPYTTAPYYYRVQAINGTKVRYSDIGSTYLRPATPTGLRAVGDAKHGLALTWAGRPAGRYVVTQATDAALTANVRTYSILSQARSFTPYDLRRGTRYYFQVRAYGGTVASAPSGVASAVAPSAGQNVRVMTYNLLHSSRDGEKVGTETVAPWSQRRPAIMALIRKANPDVLGLQEASDWVGAVKGPRIVDDLRNRLGTYSLAHTEVTPGQRGWFRTARYVLYRTSTYRAVGDGGHWELDTGRFAAYQLLQHRTTGAKFLAVSVHLEAGSGRAVDLRRAAQTQRLLSLVKSYQSRTDVPVVYVGDFNSHERNVVDGPGNAFRAAGHVDADEVAQTRANRQFNSANRYLRTAPTGGLDIDHVYAPPGVAVRSWQLVLNLTAGRFVGTIPSDHNPVAADVVLPY
jgi:endonuclease/exonuclease/phosphatase family metal-dependent hydrolase